MYAMLVGKLPFLTPYTDQYRRVKLVQQMERGLVEQHKTEISHLTTGRFQFTKKNNVRTTEIQSVISLRPLLDC